MRHAIAILFVAVVVAPVAADPSGRAPADTLIPFRAPDQFDVEHTDAELRGRTALLLWADRTGSDHLRRWGRILERELRDALADGAVAMRVVAHGRGVPGFVKGMVKGSFSDDPAEWAIMDWEGVFLDAYAPVEDHLNLLVFDPAGDLVHRVAVTGLDREALDRVVGAVRAAAGLVHNKDPEPIEK